MVQGASAIGVTSGTTRTASCHARPMSVATCSAYSVSHCATIRRSGWSRTSTQASDGSTQSARPLGAAP
eukprot:2829483-Alexandrium_andersonii.AAC.1